VINQPLAPSRMCENAYLFPPFIFSFLFLSFPFSPYFALVYHPNALTNFNPNGSKDVDWRKEAPIVRLYILDHCLGVISTKNYPQNAKALKSLAVIKSRVICEQFKMDATCQCNMNISRVALSNCVVKLYLQHRLVDRTL
jgi:hypothetical protein